MPTITNEYQESVIDPNQEILNKKLSSMGLKKKLMNQLSGENLIQENSDSEVEYQIEQELPMTQRVTGRDLIEFDIRIFLKVVEYFTQKEIYQVYLNLNKELTHNIVTLEANIFYDIIKNLNGGKSRLELYMPQLNEGYLPIFSDYFLEKVKLFEYIKINTPVESLAHVITNWELFEPLNRAHLNEEKEEQYNNFPLSV